MRYDGLVGAHAPQAVAPPPSGRRARTRPTQPRRRRCEPNQRWVAVLAQFPTREGPLHVAAIRDLCHRGIVGWAMDGHEDTELVVDALHMALARRR